MKVTLSKKQLDILTEIQNQKAQAQTALNAVTEKESLFLALVAEQHNITTQPGMNADLNGNELTFQNPK